MRRPGRLTHAAPKNATAIDRSRQPDVIGRKKAERAALLVDAMLPDKPMQ